VEYVRNFGLLAALVRESLENLFQRGLINRVFRNQKLFLVLLDKAKHVTDCFSVAGYPHFKEVGALFVQLNLFELTAHVFKYFQTGAQRVKIGN